MPALESRRLPSALAAVAALAAGLALAPDGPVSAADAAAPVTIAAYDFDDGQGGPDPQGWYPRHAYTPERTHFHVEDFSGAGHEAAPLEGGRSMWCGVTAADPLACSWNAPPGYGSNWNEFLASTAFPVSGDVTFSFLTDMDIEPFYDYVYVQYEDPLGAWTTLDTYSCGFGACPPRLRSYTVPAADHGDSVRFRFQFTSDGAGDNQGPYLSIFTKAFLVDSMTVADATGVVDFQDFEGEAVGDSVTADGHWRSLPNTGLSSHGGLVDGATTLQESPTQDTTWFWAFLNGSDRDYGCAGHPEQLVVPVTRSVVRSPFIDVTQDLAGRPVSGGLDSLEVAFDVYRDMPVTEFKYCTWRVLCYSETCLLTTVDVSGALQGDEQDWYRQRVVFVPPVDARAIRIDLGAYVFTIPDGQCPSNSPMIDNVTVTRFGGAVSAVPGTLPAAVPVLRANVPNPFNPTTVLRFDLPSQARVSLRVYDIAGRLVRTLLVEAETAAGPHEVLWRGDDDAGRPLASGTYLGRLSAGSQASSRLMTLLR